jgi:hypothetical protein
MATIDKDLLLTERKVVRRGLLAGLAALGAAAAMKVTGAGRVEAVDGQDLKIGNVLIDGSAQTMQSITTLNASTPFDNYGLLVANGAPPAGGIRVGVAGSSDAVGGAGIFGFNPAPGGFGVWGQSPNGIGLRGTAQSNTGFGVIGIMLAGSPGGGGAAISGICNAFDLAGNGDGSGDAVRGKTAAGRGVVGESLVGNGVVGISTAGHGVSGTTMVGSGVQGISTEGPGVSGQSTNAAGVLGSSQSGAGVQGTSFSSLGVRGLSTHFTAMVGISTNNHGLYGSTGSGMHAGFVGENTSGAPGALAGYFQGSVQVTGNLLVNGAKNAIIKMQDGTMASVYCQESPEPYFEDFGRAQLVGGVANVPLEREFAQLVAGGNYHVFTEPEGPSGVLYVSRRTATGFEVRDPGNGNAPFSYRIVTRRKDIEGRRFARVTDEVAKSLPAIRAAAGAPPANTPPVVPPVVVPAPQPNAVPNPNLPPPLNQNPAQPSPTQAPDRPSTTGR